jgi:hypothetical protein
MCGCVDDCIDVLMCCYVDVCVMTLCFDYYSSVDVLMDWDVDDIV